MSKFNRPLVLIGAALLSLNFFFPLWKIGLWAPQYPEGLSFYIWIHKLSGDLQSINILNHYIGMQPIEEANFGELKLFPYALGAIMAFGVFAGLSGKRWACVVWSVALLGFCIWAFGDFYYWEYKFGHELNSEAAIKMEDMTYQPPLIGERTFLNIIAYSWPAVGGYGLIISSLIAVFLLVTAFLGRKDDKLKLARVASLLAASLFLSSCKVEPEAIVFDHDGCSYCRMTIADSRYGAESITKKGKVDKFDSIECLLNHMKDHEADIAQIFFLDFENKGRLIPLEKAHFFHSSKMHSPMGAGFLISESEAAFSKIDKGPKGRGILTWEELRSMVKLNAP